MFGIGGGEMVMLFLLLLFAVGPDKMPTFMKAIGKGLREFRRTTRELRHQVGIDEMLRDESVRDPLGMKELKREIQKPLAQLEQERDALAREVKGAIPASPSSSAAASLIAASSASTGSTNTPAHDVITPDDRLLTDEELAAEQPEAGVDVHFAERDTPRAPGTGSGASR